MPQQQRNHLVAYNGKTAIRSILSTEDAIYGACVDNQIPYESTHQLDREENEWFYIEGFSDSVFNTAIAKIGGTEIKIEELFSRLIEFTQFESADYHKIKWLIAKQGECYYFQKVTPSIRIANKTYLHFFNGGPEIQEIKYSVEVHRELPDIIYDTNADRLIFKYLSRAKEMYPGLINLYREATNEEVHRFISNRTDIAMSDSSLEVGTRNRKEIRRLLSKIESLSEEAKAILAGYIEEHREQAGLHLGDDGKIIISTPAEFKGYLDLLDERFVTSDIYQEERRITAFTSAQEHREQR